MQPKQAIARASVTVMVRTRYVGNRAYVEVRLGTPRGTSLELAHQLTGVVETAINVELGAAEAIVHIEPAATPEEPSDNLNIFHVGRQARIQLDLELAGTLTLAEAHRHAKSLESSIVREMPNSGRIRIHMEPRNNEPRPAVRHVSSTQRVRSEAT
jgi:divalent metal cation (Fe/Co/Zn/Cd) transporter